MYKGIDVDGPEFFNLLNESEEFCSELGRVVLAAGRLEALLADSIRRGGGKLGSRYATLGNLVKYASEHEKLRDLAPHLKLLKTQRNYLTHNIYALLHNQIEETILEGSNLLDSDVGTYVDRAWQLKENLNGLSEIVESDLGENA